MKHDQIINITQLKKVLDWPCCNQSRVPKLRLMDWILERLYQAEDGCTVFIMDENNEIFHYVFIMDDEKPTLITRDTMYDLELLQDWVQHDVNSSYFGGGGGNLMKRRTVKTVNFHGEVMDKKNR